MDVIEIDSIEKWMFFEQSITTHCRRAEPLFWIQLQQSIDKIACHFRNPFGELELPLQNLLEDQVFCFSLEWMSPR